MSEPTFAVHPLPPESLRQIRRRGLDDFGNPTPVVVDEEGGAPLRCCLRDTRPGERRLLIAYSPFRQSGPYAEVGPVFVHADDCPGYPIDAGYPVDFRSRPQVFRAYRMDGSIAGGRLVDPGRSQEAVIDELLADPEVAHIHSRNVIFGCYMFAIGRYGED